MTVMKRYNGDKKLIDKAKIIFATLVIVLLLTNPCLAFFDQTGMSASVGGRSDHAAGHTDSDHDFYWNSIGLFGRHNFTSKWYTDLEGDIGSLRWDGKNGASDDDALTFEGRVIILRKIWKHLHLGAGGGLCLLSNKRGHPGLGDSGFYGLITTKVRIPFTSEWGADIETDHISGVTDEDSGRNVIKIRVYFIF